MYDGKMITAVYIGPEKYGRTVSVVANWGHSQDWYGYFHDAEMVGEENYNSAHFKKDDLYFGPPDVYASLGL